MSEEKELFLVAKLSSGEEIIGRVNADEFNYYFDDPAQIMTFPDQATGSVKVGTYPFLPFAERDGIMISRVGTHVAIPKESMVMSYREFTSGIALPKSEIQLAS